MLDRFEDAAALDPVPNDGVEPKTKRAAAVTANTLIHRVDIVVSFDFGFG